MKTCQCGFVQARDRNRRWGATPIPPAKAAKALVKDDSGRGSGHGDLRIATTALPLRCGPRTAATAVPASADRLARGRCSTPPPEREPFLALIAGFVTP